MVPVHGLLVELSNCGSKRVGVASYCVGNRFPFLAPNRSGPGLYAPMLLMHLALLGHTIMAGTFAKVINTLQRIKFAQMHLAYLNEAEHWLTQPPPGVECAVPEVFSPFADQSGYCSSTWLSLEITRLNSAWLKIYSAELGWARNARGFTRFGSEIT